MKRQTFPLSEGETAQIEIEFDLRKTIRIRVHPDGRVTVRAPRAAGMASVERALESRRQWLSRHLRKLRDNPAEPIVFKEGASHFHLGESYPLSIRRAASSGVAFSDGRLLVSSASPEDPKTLERALRRWYRKQAETIIADRLGVWGPRLPVLPRHEVRFRWMKSRWGSCSSSNSIIFNTQLVKAPLACIDYVVVHELCHTLHHDHGPGFKQLLARVMPDWKAAADRLKNHPVLL